MRISGFSFARNAVALDYPVSEALRSVLPVVDELVVVVSPGEQDDGTRDLIESIDDDRLRLIEAAWPENRRQRAYADLTNLALDACTGDWCLYIQADEVLHERGYPVVRSRCEELLDDRRVEGMLFDYLHFFGDYRHIQTGQGWYPREIRCVRNGIGVRSVRDAQSFRHPDETRLTVAESGATIHHYGWARHPSKMQRKTREFWSHRESPQEVEERVGCADAYDYGPLGRLATWDGDHPAVMRERIAAMDWGHLIREEDPPGMEREPHRDERLSYRALSALTRWTGIDLNHTNHGRVLDV